MGRPVTLLLVVTLLALASLGASCNDDDQGGEQVTEATGGGESNRAERIETLTQVDTSDLTRAERRMWTDLVNDQLSPCGEPVSVARCVSEERECPKCVPAARYLVRLVTEGYEKSEMEELYALRYGRDGVVELPTDGAPVRGAPMAPITIVEFSDFECPFCGEAAPVIERLLREQEGRVKLVFLHYPLDGHTNAQPAARAAIAAGRQGKFWEMHDLLFENQRSLEPADLERLATELGLDMARFRADMASAETQRIIDANKAAGRELDVSGTPTIFVNGRRFREHPRALPSYIREELDQ
jgi:protein-disulfide isomerase